MSDDDATVALLDALQRANPVPVDTVTSRRDLPSAHALFAEITAQPPRRVRRRTLIVAIALVVLAIATVLGAFALVDHDEPTVVTGVECAPEAELPIVNGYVVPPNGDPIAACAALWRDGTLGSDGAVRGLDACVLEGGAIGVFPGEFGSVCSSLGLQPAEFNQSLGDRERFQMETDDAVIENCIGYDDAVRIVEEKLDEYGFDGWTVKQNLDAVPFSDEYPCASTAVPPGSRTVLIVPTSPAYPGQPVPDTAG